MKQFLKYTLATVTGLVLVGMLLGIIGFVSLLGIAAFNKQKPTITEGTVLHIKLSGVMSDRTQESPFSNLLGADQLQPLSLATLRKALDVAATNDKIRGIYLEGGLLQSDVASAQELRGLIENFRKTSHKFVMAYADTYGQAAYYVASAADKVYVNPGGMIDWHGLAAMPVFYTDLLKKAGVKVQTFRVGTYKSYVEPFTRTEMSEANREQTESYIRSLWSHMLKETARGRRIIPARLDTLANHYAIFSDPQQYVGQRMADSLYYADHVRARLRRLAGADKINLVSPEELARLYEPDPADDRIAVYYAAGSIVDESVSSWNTADQIVGKNVVSDFDKLAHDDDVKAVVIRINSGGGSAYASEQMWHAMQLLKQKKPVVVSMGGAAASGGYYMACGANRIIAMPTTITGSIGIFGMVPDASELLTEKLGLRNDVVKTNDAADFGNIYRPFNAAESAALQGYVNRGYALFLKRVAQGRGMTTEAVDRIAQGRVWTGEQALRLKLVDQLGNLDDAIRAAAQLARLTDYGVDEYPAPVNWMNNLAGELKEDYLERELKSALGLYYEPLRTLRELQHSSPVQARLPYLPYAF